MLIQAPQVVALLAKEREQPACAMEMQRPDGDENATVSEWKKQPICHERAAVIDQCTRQHRVMPGECRVASRSRTVDAHECREVAREPGAGRRFDAGFELGAMRKHVLQ
jgi:hypothetical protein